MSLFHQCIKESTPEVRKGWRLICEAVNNSPKLQSLVRELHLLPEEIISPHDARQLAIIVSHFSELERFKGCVPTSQLLEVPR